mgnify:CR=1 FL=1
MYWFPCIRTMTEDAVWRQRSLVSLQVPTVSKEPLFGNGERTGNVDIITLGMNMYSPGCRSGT